MNPSELIDQRIVELNDWRGGLISHLRTLIYEADSSIEEDWKWGSPVFTRDGLICSLGSFKDHVKVHFFKGAFITDTHNLFNAGLDAKSMRAIDFLEHDDVNEIHFKELINVAVLYNVSVKNE